MGDGSGAGGADSQAGGAGSGTPSTSSGPGGTTTAGMGTPGPAPKYPAPAGTPEGVDDDVVAKQLREAAETEKDPALRAKLWEEYNKYKGRKS